MTIETIILWKIFITITALIWLLPSMSLNMHYKSNIQCNFGFQHVSSCDIWGTLSVRKYHKISYIDKVFLKNLLSCDNWGHFSVRKIYDSDYINKVFLQCVLSCDNWGHFSVKKIYYIWLHLSVYSMHAHVIFEVPFLWESFITFSALIRLS